MVYDRLIDWFLTPTLAVIEKWIFCNGQLVHE